ncbi:hypothetical protein RS9917_13335 [Synechococcus sp. RS9917]|nr:hypothetical protein RS9917_13335 [Synechococcus sp. RS9917]
MADGLEGNLVVPCFLIASLKHQIEFATSDPESKT